jgi:hypothetical protein
LGASLYWMAASRQKRPFTENRVDDHGTRV